jgi:ribosomal-protein-serine acetyltransferase
MLDVGCFPPSLFPGQPRDTVQARAGANFGPCPVVKISTVLRMVPSSITLNMNNEASISIRRFELDDIPSLCSAVRESMAQLQLWMAWCKPDYDFLDGLAFVMACDEDWEADRKYQFAIQDRRDGTLLGSVGLTDLNREHGFANVAYWVRSSRTGYGVASAAIALVARFAFEQLDLNRLQLITAVGNHASMRVAEKAGAQREGISRDRLRFKGRPVDAVMYSLVAEDKFLGFSPRLHDGWNAFGVADFAADRKPADRTFTVA